MSIEQDLKTIPTPKTPQHEAFLKTALSSRMPAKRTRRMKLAPLFLLAPAFALLLFVTVAIIQPGADNKGSITQKAFGPLSAQQVFAEAEKNVSDESLPAGKYYFTRVKYSTILPDGDGTCRSLDTVNDTYTNQKGIDVKLLSYDKNMKLFTVATISEDGTRPEPGYFYDAQVEAGTYTPADCSLMRPVAYDPTAPSIDLDTELASPEYKAMEKLISHLPADQRDGYDILKSIQGWSGSELQTIPGFKDPVITLHTQDPASKVDSFYYFDQQTKQFVGFENNYTKTFILARDIRSIPAIPQADNKPAPSPL